MGDQIVLDQEALQQVHIDAPVRENVNIDVPPALRVVIAEQPVVQAIESRRLIPPGGSDQDVLTKLSEDDYDVAWINIADPLKVDINTLYGRIRDVQGELDSIGTLEDVEGTWRDLNEDEIDSHWGVDAIDSGSDVTAYDEWAFTYSDNETGLPSDNIIAIAIPEGQPKEWVRVKLDIGAGDVLGSGATSFRPSGAEVWREFEPVSSHRRVGVKYYYLATSVTDSDAALVSFPGGSVGDTATVQRRPVTHRFTLDGSVGGGGTAAAGVAFIRSIRNYNQGVRVHHADADYTWLMNTEELPDPTAATIQLFGSSAVNRLTITLPIPFLRHAVPQNDFNLAVVLGTVSTEPAVAAYVHLALKHSGDSGITITANTAGTSGNSIIVHVNYKNFGAASASYSSATRLNLYLSTSSSIGSVVTAINDARHSGSQLLTASIWNSSTGNVVLIPTGDHHLQHGQASRTTSREPLSFQFASRGNAGEFVLTVRPSDTLSQIKTAIEALRYEGDLVFDDKVVLTGNGGQALASSQVPSNTGPNNAVVLDFANGVDSIAAVDLDATQKRVTVKYVNGLHLLSDLVEASTDDVLIDITGGTNPSDLPVLAPEEQAFDFDESSEVREGRDSFVLTAHAAGRINATTDGGYRFSIGDSGKSRGTGWNMVESGRIDKFQITLTSDRSLNAINYFDRPINGGAVAIYKNYTEVGRVSWSTTTQQSSSTPNAQKVLQYTFKKVFDSPIEYDVDDFISLRVVAPSPSNNNGQIYAIASIFLSRAFEGLAGKEGPRGLPGEGAGPQIQEAIDDLEDDVAALQTDVDDNSEALATHGTLINSNVSKIVAIDNRLESIGEQAIHFDVPESVGTYVDATAADLAAGYGVFFAGVNGYYQDSDFVISKNVTTQSTFARLYVRIPKHKSRYGVRVSGGGEHLPHTDAADFEHLAPVSADTVGLAQDPPLFSGEPSTIADYFYIAEVHNDGPINFINFSGIYKLQIAPVHYPQWTYIDYWQDDEPSPGSAAGHARATTSRTGVMIPIVFVPRAARPRYLHFLIPNKYVITDIFIAGSSAIGDFTKRAFNPESDVWDSAKIKSKVEVTCMIKIEVA